MDNEDDWNIDKIINAHNSNPDVKSEPDDNMAKSTSKDDYMAKTTSMDNTHVNLDAGTPGAKIKTEPGTKVKTEPGTDVKNPLKPDVDMDVIKVENIIATNIKAEPNDIDHKLTHNLAHEPYRRPPADRRARRQDAVVI